MWPFKAKCRIHCLGSMPAAVAWYILLACRLRMRSSACWMASWSAVGSGSSAPKPSGRCAGAIAVLAADIGRVAALALAENGRWSASEREREKEKREQGKKKEEEEEVKEERMNDQLQMKAFGKRPGAATVKQHRGSGPIPRAWAVVQPPMPTVPGPTLVPFLRPHCSCLSSWTGARRRRSCRPKRWWWRHVTGCTCQREKTHFFKKKNCKRQKQQR